MSAVRRCLSTAVLCGVALGASAAFAAPIIVPVSQTRTVTASASHPSGTPSSNSLSAPDFAPFNGFVSAASGPVGDRTLAEIRQISTIDEDSISLSVNGFALLSPFGAGTATATSSFDVTFDLLVPSDTFLFYLGRLSFFTTVSGTLSGPNGTIVTFDAFPSPGVIGVLDPGRYRLQLTASGSAAFDTIDGDINQSLNLDFTAVPEPSTALLVATGLLALAARRQR